MKILFLTSLLFLVHKIYAVEEIDERQRCVDHAISLINQCQDPDALIKREAANLQKFFNTVFQVERERIKQQRAKKSPKPVEHSQELVQLGSSAFNGIAWLCYLVKSNNIPHEHLIPLFV